MLLQESPHAHAFEQLSPRRTHLHLLVAQQLSPTLQPQNANSTQVDETAALDIS